MKRLSVFLMCLILIFVIPVSSFAAATSTRIIWICTEGTGSLNLREGPGTGYTVLGYVYDGDAVTLLEEDSSWSRIRTRNGSTGWIKSMYIDGTTEALLTGTKQIITSLNQLTLRSKAGTSYEAVGTIKNGTLVTVTKVDGSWSRIRTSDTDETGWIQSRYLVEYTGPSGKTGTVLSVNVTSAKLYRSADYDSDTTGTVYRGERVGKLAADGEWYLVEALEGSVRGWILSSKLISSVSPEPSCAVYTVSSRTLNLRSGPSSDTKKLSVLKKGCAFKVTGNDGNWFQIETFDGKTGYVSQNYCSSGAEAVVKAGSLNLRKGAGTQYAAIRSIKKGTTVTVQSITDDWAYIHCGNDSGYVFVRYLQF